MDLALSEEQEQLVSSFAAMLAKASSPVQVRASEETGHDPALWKLLLESGAVRMGVGEHHDGWGAQLLDLCLIAEELGRHCASAPLIEAQVAARLLAEVGAAPAVETLASVLAGDALVVFAPHVPRPTGVALVPGGAVCDSAVVLDGQRLLLVGTQGRTPITNLASAPLADMNVAGGVELLAGARAMELFETALDEWLVLTASAVVGLSSAAHELGCSYARERQAFGSAIGALQAISHPFADDATSIDGARLLVRKAAWEADTKRRRSRELAAMAFAFASTTGETATYHALHAHGGYGFMLEYDIQLHYRRARGWPRIWGDAERAYRRAAAARLAERKR